MRPVQWETALAVVLLCGNASAVAFNPKDEESVKKAASVAANNTITLYNGRKTRDIPGQWTAAWYAGGVMFDTLINYWYYTGDTTYNDAVSDGMYWQIGKDSDYMPSNYTQLISNGDQLCWAFAAMSAAEMNFTQRSSRPSWTTVAENVFNTQIKRWDTSNCKGGMRSDLWPYQEGYTDKGALSNGGLFELAARLAHVTGNKTYSDWAEKIWDWSATTPLLDVDTGAVSDATTCETNCTKPNTSLEWSWNYGVYLGGAAYLYNATNGDRKWKSGVDNLLNAIMPLFFPTGGFGLADGKIMVEMACEPSNTCDQDMVVMRSTFIHGLVHTALKAPYTMSKILPLLQGSASAAAMTCTGGESDLCDGPWYKEKYGSNASVETQLAALSIFTSNLIAFSNSTASPGSSSANSSSGTTATPTQTASSSGAAEATTTTDHNAADGLSSSTGMMFLAVFSAGFAALF
ncbi:putative alpha-1,6-mannanase [Penicillium oxalicum 114-2]|uniref:Mannan endo-1,6-alpha-mannosidase n=1 Tax=Penicillium oxalicum (strain 114-2 / CGMCC 5302) TaxID=933388 RepID=S7Z8Z6_PENO1|nr:putative alpha-1,6-mannanase [Penicillium oxalicum 114-2]